MEIKPSNILIVDDDEFILNILDAFLSQEGHTVQRATNGAEALTKAMSAPDLILLDLQLPDMSGFDICQSLKIHDETQNSFIIMFTSDRSSESLKTAFNAGAIDYIVKPPNKTELLARVNSALALKHERDARKMRELELQTLSFKLSKYLSPQVYNSIFTGKQDVKLETTRKLLTIFFSDIVGFTKLADSVDSEELTRLLNEYFTEMADIGLKYGGTIDKFIGDAIMIFFGDPETRGEREDALNCVHMAMEMRTRLKDLSRNWESRGMANTLKVRMGINTGRCMVGNFGTSNRLEYTIVGSEVNLASRLENIAAENQILISSTTHELVKKDVLCRELPPKHIKGLIKPVRSYEVTEPT